MDVPQTVVEKRMRILQGALAPKEPHPLLLQFFNEESIIGIHPERADILFSDARYPHKNVKHSNPALGIVNGIEDFIHEMCHIVEIEDQERYRLRMESLGMGEAKKKPQEFKKLFKTGIQRERRTSAIQYVLMEHLDLMRHWAWEKQYPSIMGRTLGLVVPERQQLAREAVLTLAKQWTIEAIIENWWAKNTYLKRYWTPINNNVRCKY